jgi:hypothetical protein
MDLKVINPDISKPYAEGPATRRALEIIQNVIIQNEFNQTDLLAGTTHFMVAPIKGTIKRVGFTTTVAIGTGASITAEVNDVAVAGLAVVVPDSALVNSKYEDAPTAGSLTAQVAVGDKIEIIPGAAFATSGAGIVWIEIEPIG